MRKGVNKSAYNMFVKSNSIFITNKDIIDISWENPLFPALRLRHIQLFYLHQKIRHVKKHAFFVFKSFFGQKKKDKKNVQIWLAEKTFKNKKKLHLSIFGFRA